MKFENFQREITPLLRDYESQKIPLYFWWRDDDCIEVTDSLKNLVHFSLNYSVPVSLAVIPENCHPELPDFLSTHSHIDVLQHGYSHTNNAGPSEKKCEFPSSRENSLIKKNIEQGFNKLNSLFKDQFLPIFVPPWNRFPEEYLKILKEQKFQKISAYEQNSDPFYFNCHFDIINWKQSKKLISEEKAIELFSSLIQSKPSKPIGILSHHLVHDEEIWQFCDFLMGFLKQFSNIHWIKANEVIQQQNKELGGVQ